MKIKELIKELKRFNQEAQVFVSNDEELNSIHWGFEVAQLGKDEDEKVVIYPLSGQEEEELPFCYNCFQDIEKNGDGELESEEQADGKIFCFSCSAKKLSELKNK